MLPHPLANSEMQNYYRNEPKFNRIYTRNNLAEKKNMGLCNKS